MTWKDRIIAAHTAVTDQVSHFERLQSTRYFVWAEEAPSDLIADGKHGERSMAGRTDFFTKLEDDPWAAEFEAALDADPCISWRLNSIQYESDTKIIHYEYLWEVV